MPKMKQDEAIKRLHRHKREVLAVLDKYRIICGFESWADVAARCGYCQSTFYTRLRDPDRFRLEEIQTVVGCLHIPQEEIKEVLLY